MRYFLELGYRGEAYHGWQRQPGAVSVQEVVEDALFRLIQQKTEILGAGRTDSGVHAKQMFAHFDLDGEVGEELTFKMNSMLPRDIAVWGIYPVQPEAHARFDALSRSYEYHIVQRKDPFASDSAYLVKRKLNVDLMNRTAEILLQYNDFKCFSRSRTDVRTFKCNVEKAHWEQKDNRLIFSIKADRFLRNMVRAIVGTLLEVGLEKMETEKMHEIIQSKSRSRAGASAPAHGLYLTEIKYPNTIFI